MSAPEAPDRGDADAPWATVDLDAIRANAAALGALAPAARLLAVVKADAYGHGLVPAARALAAAGVGAFGVGVAGEALALRAAGVGGAILIFGPVRTAITELIDAGVDLTVAGPGDLEAIASAAAGRPARVHVKVDTGMGRIGLAPDEALDLVAAVDRSPATELTAVWTHLANADEADATEPGGATEHALERFAALLARLERHGLRPGCVHAANSAALIVRPDAHFDLVRPGIALYGHAPSPVVAPRVPWLRPALHVDAPVTYVKRIAAGTPVGYGGAWVAPAATVVATVRMGYADGFPRSLSSLGVVGHRGRPARVVGRVCMDQFMIDLGPDGDAEVGERVDVVGGQGPSGSELAAAAGSFVYELLTGFGARVVRRYRRAQPSAGLGSTA